MIKPLQYDAVILAGGQARRMGGADKGLLWWRGQPLIDHVMCGLQQQTVPPAKVWVSANRHQAEYAQRADVVSDLVRGFEGPLRGIQAALIRCQSPWLLVVPCDCPVLPSTLAQSLFEQGQGQAAWAQTETNDYPLCCLLPLQCEPVLEQMLAQGQRRVLTFLTQIQAQAVRFSQPGQRFKNINDLAALNAVD